MKSNKEHLMASLIIVMSFIVIGISGSYAFYENAIETIGNTNFSVTSGSLIMNFETIDGQYINMPSSDLINDNTITETDQYTEFSVELPADSKINSVTYNLYLTDIKITQNFRNSKYLKWALYDSSNNPIASGDFTEISLNSNSDGIYDGGDLLLTSTPISINNGNKHSYRLYIWLSYDPNNLQNDLLEGSLEAKVGFKGAAK